MKMKKYFGTKEFYIAALMIALPVMGQSLVENLVILIDDFMVAGLGDIKMSGVNVSGQLFFAFNVFMNAICASCGIFLTQFFGAKDSKGMQQALAAKYITCFVVFLIIEICCFIIPRQALSIMLNGNSQADAILNEGVKYMRIMGFTALPMMVSFASTSSLREIGEVKAPFIIALVSASINAFFNYCLIYGNFGCPRLEVVGAAIATVIAKTTQMIICLVYLNIRKPDFLIKFKDIFHINIGLYKTMLIRTGMILLSEGLWVITETITSAVYNGRGGADVVSGMSCSFSIANLFFVAFNGVYTATSVIIGKQLGEGKLEQARIQGKWLLNGSFLFGFIFLAIGYGTTYIVPIAFSNLSLSAQTICRSMVTMMSLFMPIWVYNNTQFALSRSGGDTKMGMWVDGIAAACFTLPGLFIMARYTNLGPVQMYLIIKCIDFFKVGFAYFWLKKEYWIKNLAAENKI